MSSLKVTTYSSTSPERVHELAKLIARLVKDDDDVERLIEGVRMIEPEVEDEGDTTRLEMKAPQVFPPNKPPLRALTMVLCYRETVLYDLVKRRMEALGMGDCVKQGSIAVGDIQWQTFDGEPFGFVVERKTVADLAASIVDPRWKEQCGRMLAMGLQDVMMYIVDGNMHSAAHGAPFKSRLGSIINKVARDKVRVAKTDSVQQTAEFLVYVHMYLEHVSASNFEQKATFSYGDYIKGSDKKRERLKEHNLERILLEVNGVSTTVAQAIKSHYPTVASLISAYLAAPERANTLLKNIVYTTVGGHQRFIGPAVSKEVASWFEVSQWRLPTSGSSGTPTAPRKLKPNITPKPTGAKRKIIIDADDNDDGADDDDGYISDPPDASPHSPAPVYSLNTRKTLVAPGRGRKKCKLELMFSG